MTTGVVNKPAADLTTLLLVAALVIFVVGALLAFAVFGSVTLLQLVALICAGLACYIAAILV